MTYHFNDFRPEPNEKSLGPNSKFLTNRIALFCFQIGLGASCKPGPHSHIGGKKQKRNTEKVPKVLEFVVNIIGTATWRSVYSSNSSSSDNSSALSGQNRPKVLAERDVEGFRV
jgi:hypothetical protein